MYAQCSPERFTATNCIAEHAVTELTLLQRLGILIIYGSEMVISKKKPPGKIHKL